MRIAAVLDNLDHTMRPPGGHHGAVAELVGAENLRLLGGEREVSPRDQLAEVITREADFLQGDEIRRAGPQYTIDQTGTPGVARVILHIQREDSHCPSGAQTACDTIRHADFPYFRYG
jgi:hypothetical protein